MASILRSSKFARYVVGFARNVVVNTPREFDGNFVNASQCLCGAVSTSFSSQASLHHEQNLEKSIKRIDQDVRKSGRISKRDIEDVLEEIRSNRSATTSQSLLVIRCCGNLVPEELPEVRTKLVKEIWHTLNKLNIPMDVSHYNALLRVYLENEYDFSPVEFLAEMKEKNIEPNRVTYQRLIMQYCMKGDIEGATNVLEHMKQQQLPVNESVFNALIVGHSNLNDMESAKDVLNLMTQAGLQPSADTYTTLLSGYAKQGDIENMKKIIEECESKEIYLLDKDFLEIATALALNGHEQHLPVILEKIRKAVGYNQDAVNTILNLVNKAREKPAYEILKTMSRNYTSDGKPVNSGVFFIKQLVKMRRPTKNIVELCERMESDGLMQKPLLYALEIALQRGLEEVAYPLMEELEKRGQEIRPHFFWPLICARANDEGNEGVLNVLKKMKSLGIPLNSETIKDYVIPNLKGNFSDIIKVLTESDISVGSSALNIAISLLKQNKIKEVSWLMSKIAAYYNPQLIDRYLSQAFYKTEDLDSYITIVREIYENLDRRTTVVKDNEKFLSKPEIIGELIEDLSYNKMKFPLVIESVLTKLKDQGLSISTKSAEKIQESLGEKINDNISSLLATLSSGELTPVSLSRKPPVYIPSHQMNIPQLEKLIENCSNKNMDVRGLKRQLFTLYYRARDLEKMETLLEDMKKTPDFFFSTGIYAQLMDLYAHHENFEKATEYLEKVKELEKDKLTLSDSKILRYALLLNKNDKFEEALKFMEETSRDRNTIDEERNFVFVSLAWRFMNSLAEKGRVQDLERLFNLLVSKEYVSVSNVLLGPLIKVHLVNNDLDKALAKFEEIVKIYKATPWKNELACRLIQAEDAEKLQKLTDLSTIVHGEINSLYDLVFSFIECGRTRQARRILETPGLHNRPHRLNSACERYRQEGMVKPLEHLKDATKDLNHIDRSEIYYQLLLSYIKEDDAEKASGLWTQMQEENLAPSDQFLIALSKYLQEKGMDVPFIIPEEDKKIKIKEENQRKTPLQNFRHLLKTDRYLEAFEHRKNVSNAWSNIEAAELLEKLVQNNELDRAYTLTMELIAKKNPPVNRVFKFTMNRLALAGKVDEIKNIGEKIDMNLKKLISYDNRFCHAMVVSGKSEEYLDHLDKQIDNANTEEELKIVAEKFPRGGAYGILEHNPELLEKYEAITKKYADKGILAPVNILWTHYFTTGQYEKAKEYWDKYLQGASRIMFQRIVQVARNNQNEELIRHLIDHLKTSKITEGALGNVYSCWLDIKYAKGPAEDVVETFEKALKDVSVDYMNRTAVLRVKNCFDELGKPFNHKIPNKNKNQNTTSSSDSSSDFEKNKK